MLTKRGSFSGREAFLRAYKPAAKRFRKVCARRSASSRKNGYDLFFAALHRSHLRIRMLWKTFFGRRMHILLPEYGSCTIVEAGIIDLQTPLYFAAVLRRGSVCFDGGANFGFYSLLAHAMVGESGGVHSFEPAPFAFSFLQKNLRTNRGATLVHAALSNSDGSCSFINCRAIAGGFSRVDMAEGKDSEGNRIEVQCLQLDTYCAGIDTFPDLIKLDVEGHELAALQGAERTITQASPFIILEYGMAEGDNLAAARFLLDRGYRSLVAEDYTIRPCSLDEIAASAPGDNYLFAAPDRLGELAEWMV